MDLKETAWQGVDRTWTGRGQDVDRTWTGRIQLRIGASNALL